MTAVVRHPLGYWLAIPLWAGFFGAFSLFAQLRALADETAGTPLVEYVIVADRTLGFGNLPTLAAQAWAYTPGALQWWDYLAFTVYAAHFPVIVVVGLALMLARHTAFAPYLIAVSLTHLAALPAHWLWPTVPPWMASELGALPAVARVFVLVGQAEHPDALAAGIELSGNDVAAMPSLHGAVACLVVLAAARSGRWPAVVGAGYATLTAWAAVYGGEHYVVDLLAGAALAWACWLLAHRLWGRLAVGRPVECLADPL